MVLEDDAAIRRLVVRALAPTGARVIEAGTIEAARGLAPCQVLVSDVGLPDGCGLDFAAALRASGWSGALIVMTGEPSPERALRAEALYAEAFLIKPVAPARLCAAVRTAFEGLEERGL